MDFTVTSTDETWLLRFTYPHREHVVVVYLGDVNAKQPSTIDCIYLYPEVPLGSAISITGSIQPTPSSSDGTVTVSYTRPDGTVLNLTVPIAVDGTYDDLFVPDIVGEWHVTASWSGDATLDGASSASRTFTVISAPTGFPLELGAFGLLTGIIITAFVLFMKKRPM